jgi:translation initiation factor 2 subunit 3
MNNQPIINIGCLGCVSDGKSTLIDKLTGIKTQKHSQEKVRNITIKQGYGNMKIWKDENDNQYHTTNSQYDNLNNFKLVNHISFIDCPGHNDYIKTLLGATSLMDGVIIVIAVDQPISNKQQLLQHLFITKIHKINKIIICLNKIDLVDKEVVLLRKKELDDLLVKYDITAHIIIPTCFNKMIGINNIINSIMDIFNPTYFIKNQNTNPLFRISRSFDINKPGTDWFNVNGGIIGGALINGTLNINDEIEIRPGIINKNTWTPIKTKIISIKSDTLILDKVLSGGLIGLGTNIDPYYCKNDMLCGNVLGLVDLLPQVYTNININTIIIDNDWLPEVNNLLHLQIGTSSFDGNIISINNNIFNIELFKPVCITDNDNIIICFKINNIIKIVAQALLHL